MIVKDILYLIPIKIDMILGHKVFLNHTILINDHRERDYQTKIVLI